MWTTIIAVYFLLGGIFTLPTVDDLKFSELVVVLLTWPLAVGLSLYMVFKKEK